MRLFVGIALADAVVRELAGVVARLRARESGAGGLRWTGPESWHITLQFLGNANQEQYACLATRLGEVLSAPVPVELGELGCFDRAGAFFANVAVTPELAALEQRVVAATSRCGFVPETRPFHPHITLARKTGNKGARDQGIKPEATLLELATKSSKQHAFTQHTFTRFAAHEFLLYESHTEPEGARYEVRARYRLS